MSQIQYNLIETDDGQEFLTVLLDGNLMPPIDDSHPNYDQIKGAVVDGDEVANLADLFDVSATVARKFEKLSERVTVRGGTLFFDGDPIDGTVVETVLRFIDEDKDDWQPLVNYIENIQTNPEEHSRIQLFDWLRHHETISLNEDGLIIAYKGVANGGTHPETGEACWKSTHAGQATVDGININGYIPNYVGATVEMPRSAVMHDPNASCHAGLHVGTFPYAEAYGRSGVMLAVLVNPRDVVSVPHDARGEKIRVARYKVLSVVTEPYDGVLIRTDDEPEPSLPEDDGIDLSFEDAEEQYVPKVGDFVTLDRTKDNFLYVGTIAADDNGKLTITRPETGKGSLKEEWPDARSYGDDSDWCTYPGEGVSLIDEPNVVESRLRVGDRVASSWSPKGFTGTVASVPGVPFVTVLEGELDSVLSDNDLLVNYVVARDGSDTRFVSAPYFIWAEGDEDPLTLVQRPTRDVTKQPFYVGAVTADLDGDTVAIIGEPKDGRVAVKYVDPQYKHVAYIHTASLDSGYLTLV